MTKPTALSRPSLNLGSVRAWREWLEDNHQRSDGVWLVIRRSSKGKQPLTQLEALEEALCFGWIDSLMRPVDEEHFMKLFTPRRPGSTWSQRNLDLARRLISEGRMHQAGAEVIDWQQEGWEKEFDTPPKDLVHALKRNEAAWKNFDEMPQNRKRIHVHFVVDAKRDETRRKRIEQVVKLLAKGKWLGIEYTYRRKDRGSGKA